MNNSRLSVEIGDLPVALELRNGCFPPEVLNRYAPFLSQGGEGFQLSLDQKAGRVGPYEWQPQLKNGGPLLRCKAADFVWTLDFTKRRGTGVVADKAQAVDSLLRVLYSSVAEKTGGLLLHGAAFAWRGAGYLFLGPSGAGKTTLMRKLRGFPGLRVLSDELVLARPSRGGFTLCSTPFWGEFRLPQNGGSAPLRRIFFLRKSKSSPSLEPVSRVDAQRRLLQCAVSFSDSKRTIETLWDGALALADAAAPAVFSWSKRESPARLVRSFTRGTA